jgi:hypothetical protein
MKFLTDILARAGLVVEGVVTFNNVANATIDTDKFLTVDSGVVKYRTGSQLLSDIGGQPLLTNPVTGTGTAGQVAFYNGTSTITGDSDLYWDNTNKRLGVGASTPYATFQVGSTSGAKYIGVVDTADTSYNIAYFGHNGTKLHIGFSNSNTSISERNAISIDSSTLYVGLGVSAPANRLQIGSLGATGYSGNHFAFGNGTAATAFFQSNTSTQMYVSTYLALVGNMVVGGLTSGGYNLEVIGTFRASSTVTFSSIANATTDTDRFLVSDAGVIKYRTGAELLSDIGAQAALTNAVTGTGTSGQVAYFNGTSTLTSSATFAFTPTSQLLVNNSVTAASGFARGNGFTPTLTAAANNDILVGLDIIPTFTNGAFTGVQNIPFRAFVTSTQHITISPNTSGGNLGSPVINAPHDGSVLLLRSFSNQVHIAATAFVGTSRQTYLDNNTWGTGGGVALSGLNIRLGNDATFQGNFNINNGTNGNLLRLFVATGNLGINQFTDAGFRLDVNGTARVQGVITGSVNGGSLTLGAATSNTPAINISGYYVGSGAISTSNSNARSFNTVIGGQNNGIVLSYNSVAQGQTTFNAYFVASGNINLTDGAIDLNGFHFGPTIVSATGATIKAFSSGLSAANNRWNLFMSGTASNYLEGDTAIGTTTLGTATKFTLGGSETASSAIARGGLINTTLVAAANNDVLVGLDINPTFTNGAFTGVQNIGLRVAGGMQVNSTTQGFLPPRMTAAQRAAIVSPATGLIVYQTDGVEGVWAYTSSGWKALAIV